MQRFESQKKRRRRLWALSIGAGMRALLVAAAAWIWFSLLPAYRGKLQGGESYGIDVSSHQNNIDWSSVRRGDFVDDHFATNWAGSAAAGLKHGAYHFFTLCRPGADQADNFLRIVPPDPNALPPIVDLAFGGNCSGRPSRESFLYELNVFVDRVEAATGRTVVFYLLDDFDKQYGVTQALNRKRWVRSLFHRPNSDNWLIWQSSNVASVAGIDGGVDLDVIKIAP